MTVVPVEVSITSATEKFGQGPNWQNCGKMAPVCALPENVPMKVEFERMFMNPANCLRRQISLKVVEGRKKK